MYPLCMLDEEAAEPCLGLTKREGNSRTCFPENAGAPDVVAAGRKPKWIAGAEPLRNSGDKLVVDDSLA